MAGISPFKSLVNTAVAIVTIHTCVCPCASACVCMRACVCVCMRACVCASVHACVCVYACMYKESTDIILNTTLVFFILKYKLC